jgi:hypothetical protein
MFRTLAGAVLGFLFGAALAAGLLFATVGIVRRLLTPEMAVEHGVIYLSVVLGAGFGAVTGALVGLAGTVRAALRSRPPESPPTRPAA